MAQDSSVPATRTQAIPPSNVGSPVFDDQPQQTVVAPLENQRATHVCVEKLVSLRVIRKARPFPKVHLFSKHPKHCVTVIPSGPGF